MKSVAIIPLREGSKGIPGKNKVKILGRPLYQWCLGEAIFSDLDEIYVFTDDKEIINQVRNEYSWAPKVKAIERSEESASDTASTEQAMLEFSDHLKNDYDIICLLQATSPLTTREDINKGLRKITSEKNDSALSVVNTKRFIWNRNGESVNYDYANRPRRQDFDGLLIENGAVYVSSKDAFLKSKNRLSGKIGLIEMPEDSLTEIDETSDLLMIEKLLLNRLHQHKRNPKKIKAVVLDVDGVFTDGKVQVSPEGELAKTFSMRDGMGLAILRNSGVDIMVMTSENSPIVAQRMEKLGIKNLYMGVMDKYTRLNQILLDKNISRNEIAYIGDDINDMANLNAVSWGICPNDAIPEVKQSCDLSLTNNGGNMAIREAVEFIINYNKRFK
ncbi:cytidylyltransferase domain-containing protein [Marinifilum sp.]|uniref:cytidylyltransferase domain-containing protein n=1 Tax=Marinifilum sp. TaxID=2033137 RepID=UPI003BA9AE6B